MIYTKKALTADGWQGDVRLTLRDGEIDSMVTGAKPEAGDCLVETLIPGIPNVHSHAFQRGFSGLTERRGAARESFWTWREMMYRFALSVDPDDVQALAEMAYVEMLEAGYTRVGEFHYLHHDQDGRPYGNPAELSSRIFAAASNTGIALTHLPVYYAHGGFGGARPDEGQRRFIHDIDQFAKLVELCDDMTSRSQDRVGFAPHSLRAATPQDIAHLIEALPERKVHIHIAEQIKEVEDCKAAFGARPVDFLFDRLPVDADWCLIHATHLTDAEAKRITASGAVAGLCPVTEANLGDGLFPAEEFLTDRGAISIGTDSNIRIDVAEELRILEYGQRLAQRERNVLALEGGSTARRLIEAAISGGHQALGGDKPKLAVGAPADFVALQDPNGLEQGGDSDLDRWVFGRDITVSDVWAGGKHLVRDGRHCNRDRIQARFAETLQRVLE